MFQSALEILEPCYVLHYELDKTENTLHVYIDYQSGATFSYPKCESLGCKVHDILNQNRTILHARMPCVNCVLCGKVKTVLIDWARPSTGLSTLFESHVMS